MLGVAVASSRSSELGLEVHQGLLPVQREMKPGGTCLRCHLLRSIEVLSWTCFGLAALLLAQSNLGKQTQFRPSADSREQKRGV